MTPEIMEYKIDELDGTIDVQRDLIRTLTMQIASLRITVDNLVRRIDILENQLDDEAEEHEEPDEMIPQNTKVACSVKIFESTIKDLIVEDD